MAIWQQFQDLPRFFFGPFEIVDFPIYKMVDLSSSLCKCLKKIVLIHMGVHKIHQIPQFLDGSLEVQIGSSVHGKKNIFHIEKMDDLRGYHGLPSHMAGDDGVLPRLATGATRVSYPKSFWGPNCGAEINRGCGCWGKFAGNIPSGKHTQSY